MHSFEDTFVNASSAAQELLDVFVWGMSHNVFSPDQMAGAFMPFILNPSFARKPSARAYRQIQPLELRNSERKPLTLPYNQ
jgi:hypothetical protein